MPKRSRKKMLINNLTSRSRNLSQEHLEEHRHQTDQVSQTSHSEDSFQESLHENNQVSARPTRAAKVRCSQNLTNITRAERSYDLEVSRERAAQRLANENNDQRQRRLQDSRQRAAQRVATESDEQRKRRLQDLRQRAAQRVANKKNERERRLQELLQYAAQREANKNDEQRKRRLQELRQYAAQRVANKNDEKRERRLQDVRQYAAKRVANENNEQRDGTDIFYNKFWQISDLNNVCIKNEESEEQIEESQGQHNDILQGYLSVPVKQETIYEDITIDQHGDSDKLSWQISDLNNVCIKNEVSEEQIEESQGQHNDLLQGYISVPVKQETIYEDITKDQHGDSEISEPVNQETTSECISEDQHGDSEMQDKSIVDRLKFENEIDEYEVDAAMRTISIDVAPMSWQPVKQEASNVAMAEDQHGDSKSSPEHPSSPSNVASCSVSWPAKFEKRPRCASSALASDGGATLHLLNPRDEYINCPINYVIEPESDNSDDEEDGIVFRVMIETPLDQDTDDER